MDALNMLLNNRQRLLDSRSQNGIKIEDHEFNTILGQCKSMYDMLSENEKLIYRDEVVVECGGIRTNGTRIKGNWKRIKE